MAAFCISFECPRQCMTTYCTFEFFAITFAISGSARPPLTSFTIVAPAPIAAAAVDARIVSMLMVTPSSASSVITGITRIRSSSSLTRSAPGRVDSPPTSMMSTPSEIISLARLIAASKSKCLPPSAKESGVTLRIPITRVRSLSIYFWLAVISAMASARVAGSRSCPRTALVRVLASDFLTPRIDIHKCSQFITTITPAGSKT